MIKYLKLIRLPNLLMVPLTMWLLVWGIIQPMLDYHYSPAIGMMMELQMPQYLFWVLVLTNVFLGAAGYVINDYFDRKIDSINRPDKVLVGKTIYRRTAIIIHWVFNGLAMLGAVWLSYYFRKPMIFIMFAMIAGVFWMYSTQYKKQLLIGNFVVAMGTAMIPLQVLYFELLSLNRAYAIDLLERNVSLTPIAWWLAAFALFAFLTNFIREIVKDIEDYAGDQNYGCNTIPVAWGIKTAKALVYALSLFIALLLLYFEKVFLSDFYSFVYFVALIIIPLLIVSVLLYKANRIKHYHRISIIIKGIMLMGILYAIYAHYKMVFIFSL